MVQASCDRAALARGFWKRLGKRLDLGLGRQPRSRDHPLTVPPEGLGGLNRGDPHPRSGAVTFAMHTIVISRYVRSITPSARSQ